MPSKNCAICNVVFTYPKAREGTAKYCSRKCSDSAPRGRNTVSCSECGVIFPLKKSHAERNKVWGSFCSTDCNSAFRKRAVLGESNPNYRGNNFDSDGYKKHIPHGKGSTKLHHYNAFIALGIDKLPKGGHIHHRDCDILNNSPENLQLISIPDHKWLHSQYGSATLWAITKGRLCEDEASSWSSDPFRAKHLLMNNVLTQGAILKHFGIKDPAEALVILSRKPIRCTFTEVDDFTEVDQLTTTARGTGGFGSTGA